MVKIEKSQIAFFCLGLVTTLIFWRIVIPLGVLWLIYQAATFSPVLSKLKTGTVEVIKLGRREEYGIPIEVFKRTGHGWWVRSAYPELKNTEVSFEIQLHPLNEIRLIDTQKSPTLAYQVAKQISAPTKELYGELGVKLAELEQKIAELERIEVLARSSEIYSQQAELYARALYQLDSMLEDGYKLCRKCEAFIRETLIGAEISKLEPTTLPDVSDWKIEFQEKYRAINTQYQTLNDEVEALVSLQKEANL